MKSKKVKFSELSKGQKIFRICNLVIMALFCLACVGISIWYGVTGDTRNRLFSSILMAVVIIAPFLVELIFRFRFNNAIFLGYQIYCLFAGIIGSALDVYKLVWWYDVVVHVIMGYMAAMLGLFVLSRIDNYKKFNLLTVVFVCLCFSLAVELVWELFERFSFICFHQSAQGEPILTADGRYIVDLRDTIEDLLCNLTGAIIFSWHFLVGKLTKCHLGIPAIEKCLTERATSNQTVKNDEISEKSDEENETSQK